MNYNERIGDDYLKANWKDGQIIQHTDLNTLETIIKAAINANYEDIQKIIDGTYTVASASGISGAMLSKYADEVLQNSDAKIPSSLQVKSYVDAAKAEAIASIPSNVSAFTNDAGYIVNSVNNLTNYYLKSETYNKTEVYTKDETDNKIKTANNLDYYYLKTQTYTKDETDNKIKTANNLDYYYLKTQTYNQSEINNAISNAVSIETTNRQNADNGLQCQIDALTVSSDVVDIVGTYTDLQNYDTTKVTANDIIKVLSDSAHNNALSYYRWTVTNNVGAWVYVGSEGPFYTKSETDTMLYDYVTIYDYALSDFAGVIKADPNTYGIATLPNVGLLYALATSYADYLNKSNSYFISKGTLENVITGKDLTTKAYVDGLVGDISTALDTINGEVI